MSYAVCERFMSDGVVSHRPGARYRPRRSSRERRSEGKRPISRRVPEIPRGNRDAGRVLLQTDSVSVRGSSPDPVPARRIAIYTAWGFLLLPAQGVWLVNAIDHGGAWWALWACVLAALILSIVDVSIRGRRRGRAATWPPLINSLLIVETVSVLGYVLFKLFI